MGGSSSTKVKQKLSPEQKRLIATTERLAGLQESLIGESAGLVRDSASTLTGLAGEEEALASARNALSLNDLQFAQNINAPLQEALTLDQANRILQGASPTDSQRAFLGDIRQNQIASGQSDIAGFYENALGMLGQNLGNQGALRALEETPNFDRGGRIAGESARLQEQLASNARAQEASNLLNFPLQEGQAIGGLAGDQLNRSQAIQQFQSQLRQQSLVNRAQLQQQQVGQLAGLATGFNSQLGSVLSQLQPNTTTTTSGSPGALGFLQAGAGAVGLAAQLGAFGCSRRFKRNGRPVAHILPRIKALPVEAWDYHKWIEDGATHIGPYAEDFQRLFGVGDGVTIHPVDAFGVCLLAIQELTERVEALE